MEKTILHCDLNNFYASVEQKLHPEFDGLPLAVSGNPKVRHGIILAKNQIAKMDGVKTGDAIWQAKQKSPNIVLIPPHFDLYVQHSKQIFEIYTRFTDKVERFGIDECWLDVTGCDKLFGNGKEIADTIRETVKKELGLTISVGVSFTKILAKLGSDLKKPDATTVLEKDKYMEIVGNLPASELIMIGKRTAIKLQKLNIHTIKDLANSDYDMLRQYFGIVGDKMINSARGIEMEEVKKYYDLHIPKSVSNGTTTPRNIENLEDAKIVIYALSELIAVRLRQFNLIANGIGLYIKNTLLESESFHKKLPYSTSNASDIAGTAISLLENVHNFSEPLRAITIAAIRLENKDNLQFSLFDSEKEKEEALENTVDKIRTKYGYQSLKRGILLKNDLAVNLHEEDEFKPFQK